MLKSRFARWSAALLTLCCMSAAAHADENVGISWDTETLSNGLKVIYVPMPSSPVTHVRVIYHVGSRDERADRQGFAHMFEHMMFRGSAHVEPEQHMRLVSNTGGYSNAFTSFDETVYHETLPAVDTNLALWLEADRMSSFKVSPQIFYTERLVVAEEWRMRQNKPYGTMFEDMFKEIYKEHSYHWTPIGNMQHLRETQAGELQAFFNKYYVPSNAILVIAGNINVDETKKEVQQYFSWMPKGAEPERHITQEPEQTEQRSVTMTLRVPLPRVTIGYKMPPEASDDSDALDMAMTILGGEKASRLYRHFVSSESPTCVQVGSMSEPLQDGGFVGVSALLMNGNDPEAVKKALFNEIHDMAEKPVTAEELETAKQAGRVQLAKRWETAESAATEIGDALRIYGDANHVKTDRTRLEAITAADIQRVMKKYMQDQQANVQIILPGIPAKATTQPKDDGPAAPKEPVAVATALKVSFPDSYPAKAPVNSAIPAASFEKGVEKEINGVKVVVMTDHRVPTVTWSLTTRMGGYADPKGKEGLADLTAEMVRRGPKGTTYNDFNQLLESRAISISVHDENDGTNVAGFSLTEDFPLGLAKTHEVLTSPAFDPAEFQRLKAQTLDGLRVALNTPNTLSMRELNKALYGDSPMGRNTTPESVASITLDDVKNCYNSLYSTKNAVLIIAGDITVEDGQKAAAQLLEGLNDKSLPEADYTLAPAQTTRRILLVDDPASKQATILMGDRSYSIRSDEKFAGSVAGQILSAGIESRLGKYVRAEKGYVYGIEAAFQPNRQKGMFVLETGTKFETTADTVEASLKVFQKMKDDVVTDQELNESQSRVAGQLLMSMQTVESQATRRAAGILNDYPIDYYDKYAARIGEVTKDQIKDVMNKYVVDNGMTVVIVAPAQAVKTQLERLGKVEVIPLPTKQTAGE